MRILVREADRRDVPAVAHVHVTSWRETYRGIMPDGVLAARRVEDREQLWGDLVDGEAGRDLFVASVDDAIVGFGACGPARDALLGTTGEVLAVYVLKRWHCRGVGSALMGAMSSALKAREIGSVGLWVARDNVAAIAFYRALGGTLGTARTKEHLGFSLLEMAMVWEDCAGLTFWDDRPIEERCPSQRPSRDGGRSPSAAGRTACRDAAPPA